MNLELKSYHLYIGLVVFSFLTFLGIVNDVGWSALLLRSTVSTAVLTVLSIILDAVIRGVLFPPEVKSEDLQEAEQGSQLLDMIIPEEDTLIQTPLVESDASGFRPFVPQQINPEVESMIRNDPAKAAEIIRKMGLE